jgi:2-polyprenyl-6-methoxyphenol hydroxylase-like FAD-dependent oxidoreductase
MNVLISGAGIAGPTLAFWLRRSGFVPTLVENAPALRTSGYVIDFWGLGYDISEKMELLPDIAPLGYQVQELRIVDDGGRRLSGFGVQVFRELTGGRYVTLRRSDLSKLICDRISGSCEIIFGDSITGLRKTDGAVHVEFEHGGERCFDLVIGADGLHSGIRKLVFGRKTATRRTSATGSLHLKLSGIARATSSSTSSTALQAGSWAVSPCAMIERCSCSYSPAEASRRCMASRRKRRSCARRWKAMAGS